MVLQPQVLMLDGWDLSYHMFCTASYLAKTQVLLKYQRLAMLEGVDIISYHAQRYTDNTHTCSIQ